MKQTIEIEVPDGMNAIWKGGKVVFEDIKPQLPKTWEEFCKIKKFVGSEAYISRDSKCTEIGRCSEIEGMERNCYNDKNILPSKQAAEAHLALIQLHQLRDCYRQGWIPDLTDESNKYCIECYYNTNTKSIEYQVINLPITSAYLSFPTNELAEEFLTNFRELIEQAGDLI